MNLPFSGDTAWVELQGEQALSFIGADFHYAQYQLNGFAELQIILTDHRGEGILAFQEWFAGGDAEQFLRRFNTPAFVLFNQAGARGLMIDLYDPNEVSPINTITIGVNLPGPLALHNYDFYHYEPDGIGGYHFLAIYQNDPELVTAFSLRPEYAKL